MIPRINTFQSLFIAYLILSCVPSLIQAVECNITIIYTGETKGYLEPCGCSKPQLGGLPRRYSFIESLRILNDVKKNADPLILDNGDLAGNISQQEQIKFDIALSAMNDMRYAAMNIGENDLLLGLDYVKEVAQTVDFPLLSANLRSRKSGSLFEPYTIKTIHNNSQKIKIAIIGVLSKKFENQLKGLSDIYIEPPTKVLTPLVEKLSNESDLIVLLAHTNDDEAKEIATSLSAIDLVIAGHGRDTPFIEPVRIGKTWILNPGNRGKYVGKLEVTLSVDTNHLEKIQITKRKDETVPLEETIPESKAMIELLTYYQGLLKSQDLLATLIKQKSKYGPIFGSNGCEDCHADDMEIWRKSRHANAYQTLVRVKHEYDPECVRCHVTGFRYESGFRTYEDTPQLVGVGCEDCHGPGSAHINDVKKKLPKKSKDSCVECHDVDHDPKFDFDAYWIEVMH